jgi:hypothetical protein
MRSRRLRKSAIVRFDLGAGVPARHVPAKPCVRLLRVAVMDRRCRRSVCRLFAARRWAESGQWRTRERRFVQRFVLLSAEPTSRK